MKRGRDLKDNGLLPFKRRHIEDDKGKEEDISDSSEDMLLDVLSSENDRSDTDEACGSEQPLSFQDLPYDIFTIISAYLPNQDLARLARTCQRNTQWASDDLEKREEKATSALLLAVIQGNETEVKRLLDINPGLLRSNVGIATDYSMRVIRGLTPFQAALCAGDVEICEMMKKDYFSQLENGQAEMEKQFDEIFSNGIEAYIQTQQDSAFDFNEILQAIIHAPDNEVTATLNKESDNNLPLHRTLEKFRKAFAENSLSEIVFNPYHLLRAFETYNAKFDNLGTWDKRDLFWRQVIGFVQRYLPACYLQASAQGIYYIGENKEPLRRSFDFRWGGGSILPLRDFSGLGFDFTAARFKCVSRGRGKTLAMAEVAFGNYVASKNIKLGEITPPNPAVQARTRCVIL